MCGFTGYFNFPSFQNQKSIESFTSLIRNRGPDSSSYKVIRNKLTLIFTRLSIIDLSSSGDQPMTSLSGNSTIVFNGEIYNYKEVKNYLSNFKFKGKSDSEVILEAIEKFGFKIIEKFKGMYSFVFYDHVNSFLYLVNDRFGEKPLYFYNDKQKIFFSSDIKSFTFEKREINKYSLSNFFNNYVINYPNSIWKNVNRIKPAHIYKFKLNFEDNKVAFVSKEKYWDSSKKVIINNKDSLDIITNKLEDLLFDTIDKHLDNDVPTACFLSGGVDSSLVAAIASKINKNLNTLSIGFKDINLDESRYAIKVAEHLKSNHNNKILEINEVQDILKIIPDVYGEPFADSSQIPTLLLCKYASSKFKVCLTGDAGDELFCGYDRYDFVPKFWRVVKYLPKNVRKVIQKIFEKTSPFSYLTIKFIIQNIFLKYKQTIFLETKLRNLLLSLDSKNSTEFAKKLSFHFFDDYGLLKNTKSFKREYLYDDDLSIMNNIMIDDVNDYLPNDLLVKVDRAAMYYGLETRIPFLDHHIYEFSKTVPDKFKINKGKSKIILKKLLERHLPMHLFDRPKHGFLAPLKDIILKEKDFVKSVLDINTIKNQNILDAKLVQKEILDFGTSKGFNQYNLWDIIVFQMWVNNNSSNIIFD